MPNILLIEDNETNRDILTRRLSRSGFEVCCAIDGPSGVAMVASERPDLILMDVALGEAMDGWEATELDQSVAGYVRHPHHRADCSRARERPREERQRRLFGFRHQTGRSASPARQD